MIPVARSLASALHAANMRFTARELRRTILEADSSDSRAWAVLGESLSTVRDRLTREEAHE
eukprot:9044486-Alexandrium_andersonii.AAC.1